MFDFSFAELVVIMVAALIVIGPERLPKVARTKVQAEAGEMEKSFQEAAKTADQQVQEINEEVAKLSSTDDKSQAGQSSQHPAPPVTDPSMTTPAKKSE
jgi:Sec-independent protein translocase protein TatA